MRKQPLKAEVVLAAQKVVTAYYVDVREADGLGTEQAGMNLSVAVDRLWQMVGEEPRDAR